MTDVDALIYFFQLSVILLIIYLIGWSMGYKKGVRGKRNEISDRQMDI